MSRVPGMTTRPVERNHRVLVFTTATCRRCVRAKQYLATQRS